ncbi:MAG TPA: 1-(5-phosphoribosyl)-5-[(5-phosphoribosylamino)methylideneamino] imidazole-4-carboxamide isomerase [Candidatus Eisenbacteria bacterium]|nr:1-(5-phosphoribosyl)-5-[(5-phosphoribosylamino)methylideneamino] imidazole-4-carboxamide isomerase [Candidatus Eisenbacteria bacterium]
MRAIPAVDVREGACVQLVGGRYDDERVRLPDAIAAAREWLQLGFARLHVVDLDAATGAGDNRAVVERIVADAPGRVQVGGGIRDDATLDRWLALGAARVVVGTRALEDPAWLAAAAARHPGRIVVAVDARDGRVTTRGWSAGTALEPALAAAALDPLPLAGVLVTSVDREGRMSGPDLALVERVRARTRHPLTASGGIATLEHMRALAARGADAAVLGMALYTGALDPRALAHEFA